jgi:catechol 2,3-dioxygenase-like lactoylglutathione lyase family enzyme
MLQNILMLGSNKLIAFVATRNPANAKIFYRDTLGLTLVSEDPFAIVFDANGTMLRVTPVHELAVAGYTVLGWEVPDIAGAVTKLTSAGVQFQRYDFLKQDGLGIWTAPGGVKVAWFKDPDGNTLSLSSH